MFAAGAGAADSGLAACVPLLGVSGKLWAALAGVVGLDETSSTPGVTRLQGNACSNQGTGDMLTESSAMQEQDGRKGCIDWMQQQ
jgi:hypothetical protein